MTLWISWSSLRVHEECKQRGKLNRQRKRAPLKDQRVFFPGTVTDRVVRKWLDNDPYSNPGVMPDMVVAVIDEERAKIKEAGEVMLFKDATDFDQIVADCSEAVRLIEPDLNEFVLPFQYQADFRAKAPVHVPHPDGTSIEVILNGYMDVLVRHPDGRFSVYDVKHTRDNGYWRKTQAQLSFYDLLIQLMFGTETKDVALLQPLCDERFKPITLDEDSRSQLMQRVAGMARDVYNGDDAPRTDTTMCNWCDVKHACSKFAPTFVDGKKRILI